MCLFFGMIGLLIYMSFFFNHFRVITKHTTGFNKRSKRETRT